MNLEINFNQRCLDSIRKQRKEIAQKYNIRFGLTDIYCQRCGKPCWPGNHVCWDIRLEELRQTKKEKEEKNLLRSSLIDKVRHLGTTKVSTLLMIPQYRVNKWIQRGKVPLKYVLPLRQI